MITVYEYKSMMSSHLYTTLTYSGLELWTSGVIQTVKYQNSEHNPIKLEERTTIC